MNIYKKHIELWGKDQQIDMMIEECAELIHALQKYKRNIMNEKMVLSELADVQLMLNQGKYMFGIKEFKWIYREKVDRAKRRIEEYIDLVEDTTGVKCNE